MELKPQETQGSPDGVGWELGRWEERIYQVLERKGTLTILEPEDGLPVWAPIGSRFDPE